MKGAFIVPTASATARAVSFVLMLALVLLSGWYFIGDKFAAAKTVSSEISHGDWQRFTPELLDAEVKQGHPVFVDFTAAWCLTCKFNEANVLEATAVRDAFQRHGVTTIK